MQIDSTLHKLIPTRNQKREPITSIFKAALLISPVISVGYVATVFMSSQKYKSKGAINDHLNSTI